MRIRFNLLRIIGNRLKVLIIQRDRRTYDELGSYGKIWVLKNDTLAGLLEQFYKKFDQRISNFREYPLQLRMDLRRLSLPIGNLESAKYDFDHDKLTKDYIEEYSSNDRDYECLLAIYKTCRYNIELFETSLQDADRLRKYIEEHYTGLIFSSQ